ncbi:MAG: hypothetical protein EPO68_17015 [Planctomycetota bacterium]|nr:MAG: hypothetical protein EPO68_17015 [Planctomycetota bacterium]
MLAEHAPDRAVRCSLATVRPQLSLDVMDDAHLSISEVDESWIGCGRAHIPTDFRPLPRYGLSSTRASTSAAERLTRGPTGWAVARQVIDGPSMPHCQSPLNRRATALELLRWMLDAPRGRPSVKPTMHATLVLEDAEEFVESAAQAIEYAQGEWQDLRDKLVARGWIAAADAKAIGALTVVVNDYRFDRRERLPSIPGAEAARTPPIAAQPALAPGFPRPMKLPR